MFNKTVQKELIAQYKETKYVFQNETPNRCIIGLASITDNNTKKFVTVKGNCQPNEIKPGNFYRFFGNYKKHPRYGEQFFFTSFCEQIILSKTGIVTYLKQCEGIGEKRAEQIYNLFGENSMEAIKNCDNNLFSIKGLTNGIVEQAAQKLKSMEATQAVTIELHDLLDGSGMPKRLRNLLINQYGTNAANIVRNNPFILMTYFGVGFNLADELYKKLNLPLNSPDRQGWFLWNMIYRDNSGSIWIDRKQLERRFRKEIGNGADFQKALDFGNEKNFYALSRQDQFIADTNNAATELEIAQKIDKILRNENIEWSNLSLGDDLTPHQVEELRKATRKKIGILSGAPGTGKTFTLVRLINLLGTKNVLVCAPTGKAAVRITQTLTDYGIGLDARTIHATLGCIPDNGNFYFLHNESNPFEEEFVIVDESSMIDIELFRDLLRAIGEHTHLLLVGDPDQLPPVGIGAPLRDLIAAGIPNGHLTEIIRNEGNIVTACHLIRKQKYFIPVQNCMATPEKNLVNINKISAIETTMKTIIGNRTANDIQFIVAVNKKTSVCLENINSIAKTIFNPSAFTKGMLNDVKNEAAGKRIDVGDKVICNKNGVVLIINDSETKTNKVEDFEDNNEKLCSIANGDIGTIISFNNTGATIQLNKVIIQVPFSGEERDITTDNFNLAYGITAHRSQGSEWPVVAIFLDESYNAKSICDRHWLYTAISRAKSECYLIGNIKIANAMIDRSNMWLRKTFLVEEIQNLQWNDFVATLKINLANV
jgi:exodeoxyribonuclease V alpha subunit